MDRCVPAPWIIAKKGPLICFRVVRRTIVTNIEMDVRQALGAFTMWAYVLPAKSYHPADGVNALSPPYVLAGGAVAESGGAEEVHTLACLQQRWELAAGSSVCLLIAPTSAPREAVQCSLARVIAATEHASPSCKVPLPHYEPGELSREGSEGVHLNGVVEVRLAGLSVGPSFFDEESEWRPLLARRWLELKSYVREATIVERPATVRSSFGLQEGEEVSFHMTQGDVKEAAAVSADGSWVKWCDGSIGLMDELRFFYRTYKPARADKVVRVRRYPHRNSDVVGEVPFGLEVHGFGRETDKFTGEQYALIYLPEDPSYSTYVEACGLTSCGGLWVWGWSKIAGVSGLPFLVEVEPSCRSRAVYMMSDEHTEYFPLSKGTIFTCTRDNKGVRIRKKPSLKSEKIGFLQPNEVKEAVALLRVYRDHAAAPAGDEGQLSKYADVTKDPEVFEFVEWKDQGFSLVRNAHDTFLTKVELIKGLESTSLQLSPRELPKSVVEVRSTCEGIVTDTPERSLKRFRSEDPSFTP